MSAKKRKSSSRGKSRSELECITRKYREMEAKHRADNDDSFQTVRMQQAKITKMKSENERLQDEIVSETRQAFTNASQAHRAGGAANLGKPNHDSAQVFAERIAMEKHRIAELESETRKMEQAILRQKAEMGGINANSETSKTINKNIRMLENRLDKALVKYNESLGTNKKLREIIENLRRERIVFDGIYAKLQEDLRRIKADMFEIIEQANQAYEQRDGAHAQMVKLKEKAEKEQSAFERRWNGLVQVMNATQPTGEGGEISGEAFIADDHRSPVEAEVVSGNNALFDREQSLKKQLSKGAWLLIKDKSQLTVAQETVAAYREAFAKITNATGIEDIDQLVARFIESEETNFRLFNRVNHVSNEIDQLQRTIAASKLELQQMQQSMHSSRADTADVTDTQSSSEIVIPAGAISETQRSKLLSKLQGKIDKNQAKIEENNAKQTEYRAEFVKLDGPLKRILSKVQVSEEVELSPKKRGALKESVLTEASIGAVLRQIEKHLNQRITRYWEVEDEKTELLSSEGPSLSDSEAEAAILGVGIGASNLQPMVTQPLMKLMDEGPIIEDN